MVEINRKIKDEFFGDQKRRERLDPKNKPGREEGGENHKGTAPR